MQMSMAPGCFMFYVFQFQTKKTHRGGSLTGHVFFFDLYPFLVDGQKNMRLVMGEAGKPQ